MKILFASGRPAPPFNIGGDGSSVKTLMQYLQSAGHVCCVVGSINPLGQYEHYSIREMIEIFHSEKITYRFHVHIFNKTDRRKKFDRSSIIPKFWISYNYGFPVYLLRSEFFKSDLQMIINSFDPDVIITQLDKSDEVLQTGFENHIPTILYIHDLENHNYLSIQKAKEYHCAEIIYASKFAKNRFKSFIHCKQTVLYPPVNINDYICKRGSPEFITMINPVFLKGGVTFQNIVKKMKSERFLGVLGWYNPQRDNIYLSQYGNLTILPKQQDIREVYRHTKILLVPSVWEDCCPRVIIEAGLNGIVCIASCRGGIPEALGGGGILIRDFLNIDHWIKAISLLQQNPRIYYKYQQQAMIHSRKFSAKRIVGQFEINLKKLVKDTES